MTPREEVIAWFRAQGLVAPPREAAWCENGYIVLGTWTRPLRIPGASGEASPAYLYPEGDKWVFDLHLVPGPSYNTYDSV